MRKCKNMIVGLLFSIAHGLAFCGSPGGLQIVVVGTSKAVPHAAALAEFFKRYNPDGNDADCDGSQLNIDSVELHADKVHISAELALDAATNVQQRVRLAKLMSKFRDKTHERGLDGVLAYDVQNDNMVLYGISAMSSIKIYASALPLVDLHDVKKINFAICHALVHLPVLTEP